jgi:hypothetical protein
LGLIMVAATSSRKMRPTSDDVAATIINPTKQEPRILLNISVRHTDRSSISVFILNTSANKTKMIYNVNTVVNNMESHSVSTR